jgi:hypothetical protein
MKETFGGYTLQEIEEVLQSCEDVGTSLDDVFMDGAVACNIVKDLIEALYSAWMGT